MRLPVSAHPPMALGAALVGSPLSPVRWRVAHPLRADRSPGPHTSAVEEARARAHVADSERGEEMGG
jgi:hypothetical protein